MLMKYFEFSWSISEILSDIIQNKCSIGIHNNYYKCFENFIYTRINPTNTENICLITKIPQSFPKIT